MTISEFKSWLDGFEVGVAGNPPAKDQWEALKAAVASIDTSTASTAPAPAHDPLTTLEA